MLVGLRRSPDSVTFRNSSKIGIVLRANRLDVELVPNHAVELDLWYSTLRKLSSLNIM
jgi:hypothetical protein